MYNGADLLSNENNFLGRIVASNSALDVNTRDDITGAQLYVFAAGAQAGEGNLIVNGEEFTDVWSGTSQTTDLVEVDLTDSLAESNTVEISSACNLPLTFKPTRTSLSASIPAENQTTGVLSSAISTATGVSLDKGPIELVLSLSAPTNG